MELTHPENKKPLEILASLWLLPEVAVLKKCPEEAAACGRMDSEAEMWRVVLTGITVCREQWKMRAALSNNNDARLFAII